MKLKSEFYESFVNLHKNRLETFFKDVMSKNKFISSILFVSVEGLSDQDIIFKSNKSCSKLNKFLRGDLYNAELFKVSYDNDEFNFTFEIEINNIDEDYEFELKFFVTTNSSTFKVIDEDVSFETNSKEFWTKMIRKVNAELTLGTLKRS